MEQDIPRTLREAVSAALRETRAAALLGPRQAGKSHLLRKLAAETRGVYLSLDDPATRAEASRDPTQFLRQNKRPDGPLIIDEAAKLPAIFDAAKVLIDEAERAPSGICLANSGNFLMLRRIRETLAGRLRLLTLYPLSWRECSRSAEAPGLLRLLDAAPPASALWDVSSVEIRRSREERLLWGGFPMPAGLGARDDRVRWADDYLRTYVTPAVLENYRVGDLYALENCARLLASRTGQLLNINALSQEVGVSHPTLQAYVHQLETMMTFLRLPPFLRNARRRLLQRPKLHAVDVLLAHLSMGTGFSLEAARSQGRLGALYESFIVLELLKTLHASPAPFEAFTWRTADGAEVDLVLAARGQLLPFEVKFSEAPTRRDAGGLESFLEAHPEAPGGYVLYPGERVVRLSEKVWALPDWYVLGIRPPRAQA